MSSRTAKLVLIVIDGLAPATLDAAIAQGAAPTLAYLRERGANGLGVSAFPSLTPVCLSAIAMGAGPDGTRIPGLHWYHRGEGRFVEYGSSFEASVVAGAKQSVDDSMMNLNHLHLSPKRKTIFESVEDAGLVAASINFYVWRGRVRHPIKHRFVRRVAQRTGFFDAAYGPTRFFFGELFGSDRTGAPRNIGVGGRNDDHAGAIGQWLVARDGFDFLLFYLPETDAASHRRGPDAVIDVVARADDNIARLMSAGGGPGGLPRALPRDPGRRPRPEPRGARGRPARRLRRPAPLHRPRPQRPGRERPRGGRLEPRRHGLPPGRLPAAPRRSPSGWRRGPRSTSSPGGRTTTRSRCATAGGCASRPAATSATRAAAAGRSRASAQALELAADGPLRSSLYPNALERLWSLLACVNAGEVVVSATPGLGVPRRRRPDAPRRRLARLAARRRLARAARPRGIRRRRARAAGASARSPTSPRPSGRTSASRRTHEPPRGLRMGRQA